MPVLTTTRKQQEELDAQRFACRRLVDACERSLFDLRAGLGRATEPSDVRTGLRAAEVIEDVLAGWRDALSVLEHAPHHDGP
jgi:hypothetical protein